MPATLLLTPALADSLADAVRRGVPINTASQAAGIDPRTFYEWRRAAESGSWAGGGTVSPESREHMLAFSRLISQAQAEHQLQMVASIQRCATEENAKTGLPDWRAADAMLSKHPAYRKDWHEERVSTVDHSGTIVHEHKLAAVLPDAALDAAFAALPDAT